MAIENIDGVQHVEVSLNEGVAAIALEMPNTVTLRQIRQVVVRNGFTPRDAEIQVRGVVSARGDELTLQVDESGESFALAIEESKPSSLVQATAQTFVGTVSVPNGEELPTLRVTSLRDR